ncbi:MAG: TrkA family potassium uptake protein [Acidimicrobiia bacterium]|nr:TrkA family potassium uptake protein [Acidimicrobiia bacterium]
MRIVIAGCGRVGRDLANRLANHGHDVSIIDLDPAAIDRLGSAFNGTTHIGLAYDVDVLRDAGIERADALVAVTSSDNANLLAAEVAKEVFDVERAIARLDDPAREQAYRALDINYIPASQIVTNVVFEAVVDEEIRFHMTFSDGDVEVVEMVMGPQSIGLRVAELESEGEVRVAALRRGRRTIIPTRESVLEAGDLVVAAIRAGARGKIKQHLVVKD